MTQPIEVQGEKVLRHQEQQPLEEPRNHSLYPSLYQVNTRVWLTDLSRRARRPMTLDDIPDAELDRIAKMGFDWVWFLSVWQTGDASRHISRNDKKKKKEFHETLPD